MFAFFNLSIIRKYRHPEKTACGSFVQDLCVSPILKILSNTILREISLRDPFGAESVSQ